MKSSWKLAAIVLCTAAIAGGAIAWRAHQAHFNKASLAQQAKTWRERAEQGDATAQAELASMYYHGQAVSQNYAEALRWYRKAADQGNVEGQYGVGLSYYHGRGVAQDYGEALRWYRKAADQGSAKAENGIALMYSQGVGVSQDYAEAIRWYRKATDQGYAKAQYNLGNMYWYGRGVPQDRLEAERWYRMAADQGDNYAQRALGLRGHGLNKLYVFILMSIFLGSITTLKDPLWPPTESSTQQPPTLAFGGLCGLAYVGLSLYAAYGIFPSILIADVFSFVGSLVAGVGLSMFISLFKPRTIKVVATIAGALLVLNGLIVIMAMQRHVLRELVTTIHGFNSVFGGNGLFIGIALTLAIFLWLQKSGQPQTNESPVNNDSDTGGA